MKALYIKITKIEYEVICGALVLNIELYSNIETKRLTHIFVDSGEIRSKAIPGLKHKNHSLLQISCQMFSRR